MTILPDQLVAACRGVPERLAWLEQLPGVIEELQRRWSLSVGPPWVNDEIIYSWVAPAVRDDGNRVVLKLGMPHMEGAHEMEGLRFWDGEPTGRLIEADAESGAMLLERCEPGTTLRDLPEAEQDVVLAGLLRRLWRSPPDPHPFRPLEAMIAHWVEETTASRPRWSDAGQVREGLDLFEELSSESHDDVLLATDLHAGNVLRAQREPWLVIDPKPFIGDRAYDATQHLLNCTERLLAAPRETVVRYSDLLGVNHERVRLWLFARLAAEPRKNWNDGRQALARSLA